MKVKMILPTFSEAESPFLRPIAYSLFPPLGLAMIAAYLFPNDQVEPVGQHVQLGEKASGQHTGIHRIDRSPIRNRQPMKTQTVPKGIHSDQVNMKNKRLMIIVLAVALLLLIPLIAMRFTDEVDWTLSDFVVAGVLLLGTGLLCEIVMRKVTTKKLRIVICGALVLVLLLTWAELAVGIFGTLFGGHRIAEQ